MSRVSVKSRFCVSLGLWVAVVASCDHADAQYYRFGPRGGVSIRSPFFSMDVPSWSPRYYGPVVAVPPIAPLPSYRYYGYSYYPGYSYGYSRPPYGYLAVPGTSGFAIESRPSYAAPGYGNDVVDPYAYRGNVVKPIDPADPYSAARVNIDPVRTADELRIAAERLRQSLAARRDDSDVWLDYLRPDAVIDALNETNEAQPELGATLQELLGHYDGVAGNPELRSIATTAGFDQTRRLLRLWLDRQHGGDPAPAEPAPADPAPADPAPAGGAADVQPSPDPATDVGELPAPKGEPGPDASSVPASSNRRSL